MFLQSKEHAHWLEAMDKVARRFNQLQVDGNGYVPTALGRITAYRNWPLTEIGMLSLVGCSRQVVYNTAIDVCIHCIEHETVSDEFILHAIECEKKVFKQ